ncbi:MAG: asparaginase [Spirochaetales bacterium]|nr:asparaginase [Spirochaetales bacterium]MBQ2259691.1 asparaginase [Spirochaetales bacterium]
MSDRIRIITTGGTFDKLYDAVKGELTFRESQLPRILQQARVTLPVHLDALFAVDSLQMTESQRQDIVDDALSCVEKRVIIVHGTDTMVKTARLLESSLKDDDEHVFVFTGAMIPYSLENSDAIFNLGTALSAVQLLDKGVYVAMGGRIFPASNVRKNKDRGIFEEEL